ncbi:membrane protein [Catenulispora yoronensis]|uniref:Membrane protein n=1 Tax=Catenulispora yoronensis TaxID=450799 RepID=A0ABN2U2X3_9ACTN
MIRELVQARFRMVPPAYGYDTVAVLAHALAARRLRRQQVWGSLIGAGVGYVLIADGVFTRPVGILLISWCAWSLAYLRRIATLQTLIMELKPRNGGGRAVNGAYPHTPGLKAELVDKIARQQVSHTGLVRYGGFDPFVGAGLLTDSWSTAELVKPAGPDALVDVVAGRTSEQNGAGPDQREVRAVVPFDVRELTGFVEHRMRSVLRDHAASDQRINTLIVERRRYQRAITVGRVRRRRFRKAVRVAEELPDTGRGMFGDTHWEEDADAAREYLCVRVGSWDQELVTTCFTGFDLRGDTLHIEFHSYVLPPIRKSFHLVEYLPDTLGPRVLVKVAWDMIVYAPSDVVRFSYRQLKRAVRAVFRGKQAEAEAVAEADLDRVPDTSELRLGRYALLSVDQGARTSIRELAKEDRYHLFFQYSDKVKYTQIIQQQLLESIELFLMEHNVDLSDHRAARSNVLQGDVYNNHGNAGNMGPGGQIREFHSGGGGQPADNRSPQPQGG